MGSMPMESHLKTSLLFVKMANNKPQRKEGHKNAKKFAWGLRDG
jgi:hypothetical protein